MTLLIAVLIILGLEMSPLWYVVAGLVWVASKLVDAHEETKRLYSLVDLVAERHAR